MAPAPLLAAATNGHQKAKPFAFDPIEDALAAFGRGEFLVVMDDEGRENEGDLIVAGSALSMQKMAWMIKYTRYVRPCLHTPYISQPPPA